MNSLALEKTSFTKSETLFELRDQLKSAIILPLAFFSVGSWLEDQAKILDSITKRKDLEFPLIVRSSSLSEDSGEFSNAGVFDSIQNVLDKENLTEAIQKVIASYSDKNLKNQILVQPQLQNVKVSGVIFTKDPNSYGDYLVINYDDFSHKTDTITSGNTNSLKCYIHHKKSLFYPKSPIKECITLAFELESLLDSESLDIEFALDQQNILYLFQVRPLILNDNSLIDTDQQISALKRISVKIEQLSHKHPYLNGDTNLFGVMPDWNPAEMIGVKPRSLALSLYRELVTDAVWAYQRNNYGYQNLRSFPLMVDFEGLPYVDLRVSFNSFIPKKLSPALSNKLVNYYLQTLKANPGLHDKIEFEVVFSCYTFSLRKKLNRLTSSNFTKDEQLLIYNSLNSLTQNIVLNDSALWKKDLEKIQTLRKKQAVLLNEKSLDPLSKIYWLIEDCKRYGVLPFAGLARVGFIAVEILKSLVENKIFSEADYDMFFRSLKTVSSDIDIDFNNYNKKDFLKKYGHLRPGTYDILSPSYEESPDLYFDWNCSQKQLKKGPSLFNLTLEQLRTVQDTLNSDGWDINVLDFFEFIKTAIESREYAKFVFTKSIHASLKIFADFCEAQNLSKEDASYANITDILSLYSRSYDPVDLLKESIKKGKRQYELTKVLNLPPLITDKCTPFSFPQTIISPNFITQKQVDGPIVQNYLDSNLEGTIVFIPSADPGFDWIFLKSIKGLVTKYGGLNSHMAIRANELGIPSVIGAGEVLYQKWSEAKKIRIDCLNKQVIKLQ